jgi:hypothetical protein
MKIAELKGLPNCAATAVNNETGHAIAIVGAGHDGYDLYDGNSMTTPYTTKIEHPQRRSSYSIDEIRQMFATRKLSISGQKLPVFDLTSVTIGLWWK